MYSQYASTLPTDGGEERGQRVGGEGEAWARACARSARPAGKRAPGAIWQARPTGWPVSSSTPSNTTRLTGLSPPRPSFELHLRIPPIVIRHVVRSAGRVWQPRAATRPTETPSPAATQSSCPPRTRELLSVRRPCRPKPAFRSAQLFWLRVKFIQPRRECLSSPGAASPLGHTRSSTNFDSSRDRQ